MALVQTDVLKTNSGNDITRAKITTLGDFFWRGEGCQ